MNRFLAKIESHAAYYGLRFNKAKCVSLVINSTNQPRFSNGDKVPARKSTVYLGAIVNMSDEGRQDINTRVGTCMATLNKLHFFWKKSNCPIGFKLNVFDAVIRSKLVYSLEAVQLNPNMLQKMNAVQFRGLRRILGLEHTYVNRSNSNIKLLQEANKIKNPKPKPNKHIRPFSEYVHVRQESLLKHIVRCSNLDPMRETTLRYGSAMPRTIVNRRVGRPKQQWSTSVYQRLWIKNRFGTEEAFKSNIERSILTMEPSIRNKTI